jgi:hypothetical protein
VRYALGAPLRPLVVTNIYNEPVYMVNYLGGNLMCNNEFNIICNTEYFMFESEKYK